MVARSLDVGGNKDMFHKNNMLISLLIISTILILALGIAIFKMKNKKQIHFAFLSTVSCVFIWNISIILYIYFRSFISKDFLEGLYFSSIAFLAIGVAYIGVIFSKTNIIFSKKHFLLFIIPVISSIIAFTNSYHSLFTVKFDLFHIAEMIYGPYFYIHTGYSYIFNIIGIYYLIYFSIKNSGFFSKQSVLIVFGIIIPLIIDTLSTFKILNAPAFLENISLSITVFLWSLAIFKFDFLNIIPIALQKVVDHISDSFIVIDENYNIIDFNNTFYNNFKDLIEIKRSMNLLDEISKNNVVSIVKNEFEDVIRKSINEESTITLEKVVKHSDYAKVFDIDITSIFNHDKHIGTILLFKDITAIKNAHKQLLEQERFSSLGQLIGGIAHDMNSRLYALDGQIYLANNYINELKNNENLDRLDYIDIANDIMKQIDQMKISVSSMAKTIDSVRNHTRNYAYDNIELFSINKVIETIESLLNQKLKRHNCMLTYRQNEKAEIYIKGDFGKFESILINIISNAIESYNISQDKNGGLVEVYAEEKQNEIIISVTDNGKGIPENIQGLIFKEVLTTKGANGTGMGLYFSHSIIVGNFNGGIWFDSQVGKGTTFNIRIPK